MTIFPNYYSFPLLIKQIAFDFMLIISFDCLDITIFPNYFSFPLL